MNSRMQESGDAWANSFIRYKSTKYLKVTFSARMHRPPSIQYSPLIQYTTVSCRKIQLLTKSHQRWHYINITMPPSM